MRYQRPEKQLPGPNGSVHVPVQRVFPPIMARLDPEDAEKVRFGFLFRDPDRSLTVNFPAWRRSRPLIAFLFGPSPPPLVDPDRYDFRKRPCHALPSD